MKFYTALPFLFLRFWYIEAPLGLLSYFGSLNTAFLQLFSLQYLVVTFFKPLKNEYRKGLVGFSIGMGIVVKTFLILFDLAGLAALVTMEFLGLILFVGFPIITILLLFK